MRIVKRKRVPTNENLVGAESEAESKSIRKSVAETVNGTLPLHIQKQRGNFFSYF